MNSRWAHPLVDACGAAIIGLAAGLSLNLIAVYVRDHGPTWGTYSMRGNKAIVLLLLAPLAVLLGEVVYARRHSWLAMAFLPIATFLGLFVVNGGV
jgi:hypothetical protein